MWLIGRNVSAFGHKSSGIGSPGWYCIFLQLFTGLDYGKWVQQVVQRVHSVWYHFARGVDNILGLSFWYVLQEHF